MIVEIVIVHKADSQVAGTARVDNKLDWVNRIVGVNDGLDQTDEVTGVANRVVIYGVIGFS